MNLGIHFPLHDGNYALAAKIKQQQENTPTQPSSCGPQKKIWIDICVTTESQMEISPPLGSSLTFIFVQHFALVAYYKVHHPVY